MEASRGLETSGVQSLLGHQGKPPSLLRLSWACHAGGVVVPIPPIFRAVPALHPAQTSPILTSPVLTSPASVCTVRSCFVSELQQDNWAMVPVLVLDDTGEDRELTSDPGCCKHPRSEPARRHEPISEEKGCGDTGETLLLRDAGSEHCQFLLLAWREERTPGTHPSIAGLRLPTLAVLLSAPRFKVCIAFTSLSLLRFYE